MLTHLVHIENVRMRYNNIVTYMKAKLYTYNNFESKISEQPLRRNSCGVSQLLDCNLACLWWTILGLIWSVLWLSCGRIYVFFRIEFKKKKEKKIVKILLNFKVIISRDRIIWQSRPWLGCTRATPNPLSIRICRVDFLHQIPLSSHVSHLLSS